MFKRFFQLETLLNQNSLFLFGPRGTGKSTLVQKLPSSLYLDLLDPITFGRFLTQPQLLEEELLARPSLPHVVIIDEIQKLPHLLDVIHRLIENHHVRFLLTGSSARKLRRQDSVNLLGGRVWEAHLFPLTFFECASLDLTRYLNRGGLPRVYLSDFYWEELRAYVGVYLKEEILAEALVRQLDAFSRFLEIAALQCGEELSLEGIGSDAQVKAKTVGNYIEILEDTLLAFRLPAFWKTKKRKAITRSKFYLFDLGVTNYLAKRKELLPGSELYGRAFEQWIVLEVKAYLTYLRRDEEMFYWRSVHGQEVDLIIGDQWAIEIKSTSLVQAKHLRGLQALQEEALIQKSIVVSLDPQMRRMGAILIYPWKIFLDQLWKGELL